VVVHPLEARAAGQGAEEAERRQELQQEQAVEPEVEPGEEPAEVQELEAGPVGQRRQLPQHPRRRR
jgi:hypothetical protein